MIDLLKVLFWILAIIMIWWAILAFSPILFFILLGIIILMAVVGNS